MERGGTVADVAEDDGTDEELEPHESEAAQRIATEARDRVRFEEEALALADQVYRVARHLSNSREEAEDLVQETYARAFRSWRSFQPGTNLRAWLLRILTNLNIDRGRRTQRAPQMQALEANDYFLVRPARGRRERTDRRGTHRRAAVSGRRRLGALCGAARLS